jgi:hypothetical protein
MLRMASRKNRSDSPSHRLVPLQRMLFLFPTQVVTGILLLLMAEVHSNNSRSDPKGQAQANSGGVSYKVRDVAL